MRTVDLVLGIFDAWLLGLDVCVADEYVVLLPEEDGDARMCRHVVEPDRIDEWMKLAVQLAEIALMLRFRHEVRIYFPGRYFGPCRHHVCNAVPRRIRKFVQGCDSVSSEFVSDRRPPLRARVVETGHRDSIGELPVGHRCGVVAMAGAVGSSKMKTSCLIFPQTLARPMSFDIRPILEMAAFPSASMPVIDRLEVTNAIDRTSADKPD